MLRDVYKRQIYELARQLSMATGNTYITFATIFQNVRGVNAVSYTHLDVYKRQVLGLSVKRNC